MEAWIWWLLALPGLGVPVGLALAPVRVSVRWRSGVGAGGRLALRAQFQYLLFSVRVRGALVATLGSPPGVRARWRLIPALGPFTLPTWALPGRAQSGSHATVRGSSGPGAPRAPVRTPWRSGMAETVARRLRGRLPASRIAVSVRFGARDAMAAALGAASAKILASALAARTASFFAPGSARPHVVVSPVFGRAALEARGELVAQGRAWVVALAVAGAASAAARSALRRAPAPEGAQRASAHKAAA